MRALFHLLTGRGSWLLRSSSSKGYYANSNTTRHTARRILQSSTLAALPAAMFTPAVTKPERLGPAPDDVDKKTHHIKKDSAGRPTKFGNPHESFQPPDPWTIFPSLFKTLIGRSPFPKGDSSVVEAVEPDLLPTRTTTTTAPLATEESETSAGTGAADTSPKLRATWLGHATYYVEFPSGLRVLFDPIFDEYCAPVSYSLFKRYTAPGCQIADLPFVDAVCISHSHYDHLSVDSVREIHERFPQAHFFVGLGLGDWFARTGLADHVTECDWWDDVELTLNPTTVSGGGGGGGGKEDEKKDAAAVTKPITARISCLPSQHGSGRTAFDRDTTLWCAWAVSSGIPETPATQKSVLFLGDTGYRSVPRLPADVDDYAPPHDKLPTNPQFLQIGRLRGPFDLGLIPIGAYAPRAAFSGVHGNPFDAVEMFRDTQCRRAVGIHWGTFVLTLEELREPPRLLREALRRRGIAEEGVFDVSRIGETREY
ncbi:hypothetical protein PFICI_04456 [Pestalotiopsis fici W106-1]|uniref:Metallo-beta-lactamase domain-containing protein n=1 Tax=Pestalotiopsis fici (strain W106-1 / CGMCC3.15140) TaxID=1229662 RepID=W3X955_PESFW|nr:uncharacterized protein PFICI_04456 [Pestalotiopsis fici W106-1]ETS82580.1 hypothetical protein PFICI_04456 [Pestalotiopsis fici W106-1]